MGTQENSGTEKQLTNLNEQVVQLYHRGQYEQAMEVARQALGLARQQGETSLEFAYSLNNLAGLYQARGSYAAAEPRYQQAVEIYRNTLGEMHPDFAATLNNLAGFYRDIGEYARAVSLYQQAWQIYQNMLGEDHPEGATILNNIALLYRMVGDYAAAEPIYQRSLEIRRRALGEGHPDTVTSLNNLASLYESMGDYNMAESLYQQIIKNYPMALGENHPNFATILNNLAGLYHSMGDHDKAVPLLEKALEIRRTFLGQAHPDFAESLNNLAYLYIAMGREADALSLMEQAQAIDDGIIGQVFSIGSGTQRMDYLRTVEGRFNAFLSLILEHLSRSPVAVQAGLNAILRRKAIGAEALAIQQDAVLDGRYPALKPKLEELTILRTQIARRTLAGPGPEGLSNHQQLLTEWNAQKERLEAELARQIPEMDLSQKLHATNRQTVAQALPEESVLIEFVHLNVYNFNADLLKGELQWKPARYLAFVLPAAEPDNIVMVDLGEAELIDQMITTFRASTINEPENCETRVFITSETETRRTISTHVGTTLHAAIFNPLAAALSDRRRLLLAPDGDLVRLPFDILPTDDRSYLIDMYSISYLSTGRDVLRFGAKPSVPPSAPLVIADPDFNLGSDAPDLESYGRQSRGLGELRFIRLPGMRQEGEQIAAMLGVQPLIGDMALESRLKACQSPRILHIATHGFFLPDSEHDSNADSRAFEAVARNPLYEPTLENPMLRSGLALAGANTWLLGGSPPTEAEDGILTAEDVSGIDLSATDLVVLSAAETGLGEVRAGEGVFGLRRAFMLAGAKTLVMSLWVGRDQQTLELMVDFYRRIQDRHPRADALREAKLMMKAKYPNSFYWGAFICQGDPGPLP